MDDKQRRGLRQAYDAKYLHATRAVWRQALDPDGEPFGEEREFYVPVCGTRMRLTHCDPSMGVAEGDPCPACHKIVYGIDPPRKARKVLDSGPEQPLLFEVRP